MAKCLRDLGPHEHRGFRGLNRPTRLVEALAQHVTPTSIHVTNITNALLVPFEGGNRCHLHGREDAIVEVRLNACQCGDELGVAATKSHPPSWHVVALGERKELHCNVSRAGHLQNAGRLIPVENQIGVGKIVNHPQIMLFCDLHYPLKEGQLDTVSGWVGGKIEHQHFRLGVSIANGGLQFLKEASFALHRYVSQIGTRDHKPIGVNRVAGVRHQDRVTDTRSGQSQMRQALF